MADSGDAPSMAKSIEQCYSLTHTQTHTQREKTMLKILSLFKWLFTDVSHSSLQQELDQEAIVMEVIRPGKQWRVSYSGSYWKARCPKETPLQPGDIVYVVSRENITLIIEPSLVSQY